MKGFTPIPRPRRPKVLPTFLMIFLTCSILMNSEAPFRSLVHLVCTTNEQESLYWSEVEILERSRSDIPYLEQNLSHLFHAASLAWLEPEVVPSLGSCRVISKISIVLIDLVIPRSKWGLAD